jgi:membrane protease YdiL (CAAX protease family)
MIDRIGPFSAALLLMVCVWLPLLALKSARVLGGSGSIPVSRRRVFIQTMVLQVLLFALALAAAGEHRIRIWRTPPRPLVAWLAAALFLAIALGSVKWRWSARPQHQKERLYAMLPHNGRELMIFALVCITAGVGEEVVYRGAATPLLFLLTGDLMTAALMSAIAFALAHAVQGWRAMIAVFGIALAAQALVNFSRSLIPAMAVHASYDFVLGVLVPRWFEAATASAPLAAAAEAADQ